MSDRKTSSVSSSSERSEEDPGQLKDPTKPTKNRRADELRDKAIKRKDTWSWFDSKEARFEEAAETFLKAAAQYKISKDWAHAAFCFEQAASLQESLNSDHEASNQYIEAAKVYQMVSLRRAIASYESAVALRQANNNFSGSANLYVKIVDLCVESKLMNSAIEACQNAADAYLADNSPARANKQLSRKADLMMENFMFEDALKIYESVAVKSAKTVNGKYKSSEYIWKACCCRLGHAYISKDGDRTVDALAEAYEKYNEHFPLFRTSRESPLVGKLIVACQEKKSEQFVDELYAYDRISPLADWSTTLFNHVRDALKDLEGGGDGGGGDEGSEFVTEGDGNDGDTLEPNFT